MMLPTLLFAVLASAQPGPDTRVRAELGEIRMHLFYQGTGRLSRDISPPNEFIGWNTSIGAGSAEEYADDLVVVVEVRANGHQFIEQPLRIVARNGRRVLAQRSIPDTLTTQAGRAYHVLWIPDATCAGVIRVTASFGRETRSEAIALNCGE